MIDYEYDENDEIENEYDEFDKWEVKIDDEPFNTFDNKYDAVDSLLEEINLLNGSDIDEFIKESYSDVDDLVNELVNMSAPEFYDYIYSISNNFNLTNDIKLVCLNNEEPEFAEL